MIMSERDVFTGAHVTPEVKAALRSMAARENKSMSAIVYEAIREKLERAGVQIEKPEPDGREVPLPFTAH